MRKLVPSFIGFDKNYYEDKEKHQCETLETILWLPSQYGRESIRSQSTTKRHFCILESRTLEISRPSIAQRKKVNLANSYYFN